MTLKLVNPVIFLPNVSPILQYQNRGLIYIYIIYKLGSISQMFRGGGRKHSLFPGIKKSLTKLCLWIPSNLYLWIPSNLYLSVWTYICLSICSVMGHNHIGILHDIKPYRWTGTPVMRWITLKDKLSEIRRTVGHVQ